MRHKTILASCIIGIAGLVSPAPAQSPSRGTLGTGTEWATDYFVYDSGIAGPTVLITGGIHGNEPAGYEAADEIRRWKVGRGRIVVLPRANQPAIKKNSRFLPTGTNRDLNRNFPRAALKKPTGAAATMLWEFVQKLRPDWLIDLHEGFDYHRVNPESVGSTVIIYPADATEAMAKQLIELVNVPITDKKRKFQLLLYPAKGSLARAAAERLDAKAMIAETTKKQPLRLRKLQHVTMVRRLLEGLEMAPVVTEFSRP